jgi:CubicO group peptidase (beta-lactamase class C family)
MDIDIDVYIYIYLFHVLPKTPTEFASLTCQTHTTMDFFHSPNFPAHVKALMKEHHVPGLAIAVVQNEAMASAGYGKASLSPPKPCTADTLFDIASASKSLTAASVGLLVDDDENYPDVQYEATMSSLLPDDFVMSDKGYTEGVTVEDMLSHRTGLAPYVELLHMQV